MTLTRGRLSWCAGGVTIGLIVGPGRPALAEPVNNAPTAQAAAPGLVPRAAPVAVVAPRLLSNGVVAYPEGATGDAAVLLILTIHADGSVERAEPQVANEPFSSHAVRAALGWTFEPARRDGMPVAAKIRFEVTFHAQKSVPLDEAAASGAPIETRPAPRLQEVTIRGVRPEPSRTITLTRAEVRQIPGTFGDPFRAVEVMPGVTPIVSGLPFFFVRGAPPGDVGYFLDGIRVPVLFHVGAGPSVIHPALMERVDLYPGGYPAKFGRFSGGIVSGETVHPTPTLHGEYNARLFDAGALVETGFGDGRGTVLVGGRYSYTAALLSLLSANAKLDYWDYQAMLSYNVSRDDTLGVFAFGSYDYLGQKTGTDTLTLFGTEFHRVDLRYDHRMMQDGKVRLAATVGIDRSLLPQNRFLRDRTAGLRSEMSIRLGPSALLRAGTDATIDAFDVELNAGDLGAQSAQAATLFPSRTDLALGARADVVWRVDPRLEVIPGVRADFYSSQGKRAMSVDPRLGTRLEVSEHIRLLSAMGLAHQPPSFVVPLPGFQPGGLQGGLQEAVQESVGAEVDLAEGTIATVSLFHNGFFDLSDPLGTNPPQLNGCPPGAIPKEAVLGDRGDQPIGNVACGVPRGFVPGQVYSDRSGGVGAGADSNGTSSASTAIETRSNGASYGVELFVKRKLTGRLGGFVSYTLSRSIRSHGNRVYIASFDRSHVANAAVAYDLGRNWRAGVRLVFYTGLPKAPDPTDPTSVRLPPFFRADLRLEKRWSLGPKAWISAVAEWMNATLSTEAISTRCTLQGCEAQTIGPITIPSLGVEGGF